jgi:hypothetical protein
LVRQQVILQARVTQWFRRLLPSFRLSCARDVLQAIHPGWAIELGARKR